MSPTMQVKLLRALQEKKVRRVGGHAGGPGGRRGSSRPPTSDLEEQLIEEGEASAKTSTTASTSSPCTCRRCASDGKTSLLVEHFVEKYSDQMGIASKPLSIEAMRLLENYDWPGNVRELENVVERTLALCTGESVSAEDLPAMLNRQSSSGEVVALPAEGLDLEAYLDSVRAQLMSEALERTGGVQTQAAELLGMSFRSFRYYAKKAGLKGGKKTAQEQVPAETSDVAG